MIHIGFPHASRCVASACLLHVFSMFIPLSCWDAVCQGSHVNTCSRSRRIRTCTSNRRPKTLATPVFHSPCALALWRTPSSCITNVLFALLVLCEIPRCPLPCYRLLGNRYDLAEPVCCAAFPQSYLSVLLDEHAKRPAVFLSGSGGSCSRFVSSSLSYTEL